MTACPFCLFVADRESSRWRRRARILVGRFLKANWWGAVLFVHITPLDLRLTMVVCLMAQPCIHSRAWRSGCETARSKCANHRRKADTWVLIGSALASLGACSPIAPTIGMSVNCGVSRPTLALGGGAYAL